MTRCVTCVITRGVSSIIVLVRAFGDASSKTVIRRHATFSFACDVASFGRSGRKMEM
jgi:hypothetical protein